MKLLLCLLPILFVFAIICDANATSLTVTEAVTSGTLDNNENQESVTHSSDSEDSEAATESQDETADEETNEDESDDITYVESQRGARLPEKAINMFTNKTDAEIMELQKKLAELKYGFSRN